MSYAKKKYIKAVLFLAGVFVVVSLEIIVSAYFSLRNVEKYGVIIVFLFGFFWYPLNEKIVNWIYSLSGPKVEEKIRDVKSSRRGIEGENILNSWLEEIVGKDNFKSNVVLPKCDFDIDAVVFGDKGLIVLEVKNFSDPVYFKNDDYYTEKDGRSLLLSPDSDPRFKVRKYFYNLRNYLDSNGLDSVTIQKAMVFANGLVYWDENTGIYIIKDKESLRNYLAGLKIDPACTPEVCEKIRNLI